MRKRQILSYSPCLNSYPGRYLTAFAIASTGHPSTTTALELLAVGNGMQTDRTEERFRDNMARQIVIALRFHRRFRLLLHPVAAFPQPHQCLQDAGTARLLPKVGIPASVFTRRSQAHLGDI
jgi:hypothetical protein